MTLSSFQAQRRRLLQCRPDLPEDRSQLICIACSVLPLTIYANGPPDQFEHHQIL